MADLRHLEGFLGSVGRERKSLAGLPPTTLSEFAGRQAHELSQIADAIEAALGEGLSHAAHTYPPYLEAPQLRRLRAHGDDRSALRDRRLGTRRRPLRHLHPSHGFHLIHLPSQAKIITLEMQNAAKHAAEQYAACDVNWWTCIPEEVIGPDLQEMRNIHARLKPTPWISTQDWRGEAR